MREAATMRTNILLTPSEHRCWTAAARAAGISLAEYIRRSVAAAEAAPTADELAELDALAAELPAAAARMQAKLDAAIARLDRSRATGSDEAIRARVAAELEAHPVALDPRILDFGTSAPA